MSLAVAEQCCEQMKKQIQIQIGKGNSEHSNSNRERKQRNHTWILKVWHLAYINAKGSVEDEINVAERGFDPRTFGL